MKTHRLPCGCHHSVGDREVWTAMCPAHQAEADAIHARWSEEHRATPPLPPRQERAPRIVTRVRRTA